MAKTRSQTRDLGIKKEEEQDCKPKLLLNRVGNTRNNNKITKRKPSKNNTSILPAQQIKVEEDTDTKSLLKSASNHSKLSKRRLVSQEQINQVIDAIVNDKMGVRKAALKAKISPATAYDYYNIYKSDPEKKIPVPRYQRAPSQRFLTQEQVENLIKYIVDEKMTILQASAKASMFCDSGRYYYRKYLKDPNRAIPVPKLCRYFTQDQKNEFLGYVVNDKMSIAAASRKAIICVDTGKRYYHEYFKNQNPDVPTPSHINPRQLLTQEQISKVISYIIDDKMTIEAAAKKTNMSGPSAGRYYRQYLKDNNMERPVSTSKYCNRYTQEKKDQLIRLILDGKMTIKAAGKKLHMSGRTALTYYHQYLNDNNLSMPTSKYTQDQFDEFIGYIFDDKMSIMAASKKAKISYHAGSRYLQRYLKKHNLNITSTSSIPTSKYTQGQINEFIGYIVGGKMTLKAASKKANMCTASGYKHYNRYRDSQKRDIPVRCPQVISAPEDE